MKKKRIIVISVILLFVAVSAAAVSVFIVKRGREEKEALPPESYFSKSEELLSVTGVLGERSFEKIGLGEAAKAVKGETSEQPETETVQESAAPAEDDLTEKYRYYPLEDIDTEVNQYRDYLMSERSFLDVTEDVQEEPEKGDISFRLAGPSMEEGCYLEITIETEGSSYTVTAVKKIETWNSYVSRLWEEEKTKKTTEETEEPKSSREIAEEKVRSMTQEQLKLPEPVSSYEFISNPGLINVDGENYYRISAYRKLENGTLTYECAYLMDYASGEVDFKYDDVTEKTEPLG